MPERKRVVLLGSSGSIGQQTLDVVSQHPDRLEVVALAVNTQIDVL
ncbi:MAG: 1-deoxy-D-xylulose-5-phosphate reductoisomerase, partial [Eggerthellaceae bacterium]|nr:1-deoxy-D-xylulose-5-phosphate reductoisomerase [Eggerthellaceae bacterium]